MTGNLSRVRWLNTLPDKISSDKIFAGQNISPDKTFDIKPKIRQFCPVFAWLLYWNIGQNFRLTKFFVGQKFRHQAEISTILSIFCLTFVLKYRTKFSTDKIFRRTKISTQSQKFDNFFRRIFVRRIIWFSLFIRQA